MLKPPATKKSSWKLEEVRRFSDIQYVLVPHFSPLSAWALTWSSFQPHIAGMLARSTMLFSACSSYAPRKSKKTGIPQNPGTHTFITHTFRFHANSYLCRNATNGRYLAAPTVTGSVYVWNASTGDKVAVLGEGAGAGMLFSLRPLRCKGQ